MESLAHVVKVSLPRYLAGLPIPETVGGIFRLSLGDWVSLTPFFGILAGTTYLTYRAISSSTGCCAPDRSNEQNLSKVNLSVKKDLPKIVDVVDIEEIGDKKVFCRCWRSQKFPYCDGSHGKHNDETGDNVGPLIIKK